jgi:hypothetical protein
VPRGRRGIRDIVEVLAEAEIKDKADLYAELGVDLTTTPKGASPSRCNQRGVKVRVGGET